MQCQALRCCCRRAEPISAAPVLLLHLSPTMGMAGLAALHMRTRRYRQLLRTSLITYCWAPRKRSRRSYSSSSSRRSRRWRLGHLLLFHYHSRQQRPFSRPRRRHPPSLPVIAAPVSFRMLAVLQRQLPLLHAQAPAGPLPRTKMERERERERMIIVVVVVIAAVGVLRSLLNLVPVYGCTSFTSDGLLRLPTLLNLPR